MHSARQPYNLTNIWRWKRHRSITSGTRQCTRGINAWVCAPWMGAPISCYSLLVARAPLQGAHPYLLLAGGIRYAQTAGYWAETPSASFLPSGWCEHGSRKSVKVKSVWEKLQCAFHVANTVVRRDVSLRRLQIKHLFGDFAVQETPQWDVSTQGTACKKAFD